MNMDLMPQNLLDTQAGKALCKAGVSLQRDEDDILPYEDVEWQDGDLSAEERIFLEEFPILKGELEVGIRKLHTLADQVDTTHRTLTKTSIVANSIAVVSEVMSILGLVLAPAVAGGSLVLSAAGRVLGKAGEVTSILTNVLERFHSQEAQAYVGSLVPTRAQEVRGAGAAYVLAAGKVVQDCESTVKDIRKSIRAFQIARANPRLAAAAKNLLTTGQVSARRSRQVQRAFEGTTLVMKTKARLLGTAMAGFSLSMVLASLLKDWKQLKEGTKSELAEELRAQAWELERKLTEFTQCYESLQQKRKGPVRTKQEGSGLQARESPHRELDRPAPGSEPRSLQNYEKIHFCCFIPQTVVFISELMQLAKCLQLCGARVRIVGRGQLTATRQEAEIS